MDATLILLALLGVPKIGRGPMPRARSGAFIIVANCRMGTFTAEHP